MSALVSAGAYLPRARIDAATVGEAWDGFKAGGVREKRVAGYDEDAVTMGVEAARAALGDLDTDDVGALAFATTTPPLDEGDVGVRLAEILGLPRSTDVTTFTQSTRAGTRALLSALSTPVRTLVVVADCPVGATDDAVDHAAGAGAVALVVGADGPATVAEHATYAREYPGTRFRRRGGEGVETYGATAYGRDAFTSVVAGAVEGLETVPGALAPTATDGKLPGRAARGIDADVEVYHRAADLGDTGAASPFFGLFAAWAAGESAVAVVGFGDGAGADALRIEGSLDVASNEDRPTEDLTYAEYLRKRGRVLSEGGER
ncbi:hypothetical protein [Halomarina ordinaria]|uniref:3-hydroxy-3-methylglutaryl CoA synthase n=1 Tax=Halomarina ordinaria TaxID=3033939 RepID=A0ABD5UCQ1_9EURY|nr:hypothetical protein [Halomarina sp. PSRA2]